MKNIIKLFLVLDTGILTYVVTSGKFPLDTQVFLGGMVLLTYVIGLYTLVTEK